MISAKGTHQYAFSLCHNQLFHSHLIIVQLHVSALDNGHLQVVHEVLINLLTPNDPYMGRTAPLTSKRYILYIYSTNIGTEYFKHAP